MFYHSREGLAVRGLTLEDPDGSKLDVQLAQCFDPEDKRRILEAIVEKHGSTEAFNQKLKTKWMEVRSALFAQTAF